MKKCPVCEGEDDRCEQCNGLGVISVPTTIYLQIDYDIDEITWCEDKIYDNDLEYILAKLPLTPNKAGNDPDTEEFKTPNDNHILEQR